MRTEMLLVLVSAGLGLMPCSKKDDEADASAAASASGSASVAPATSAAEPASATKPKVAPTALPILGEEAPEFKLVEKPTAADVTPGPVTGSANGRKFEPKAIWFEPHDKSWALVINDKPLAKPTDFSPPGSQAINVFFKDLPPTGKLAGKKLTKALKYGDGYFQIAQPDNATATTSWNTDNAYYLEITKWDVKPYDPKASMFQDAGKASGKIYVVYKGSDPKRWKHSGAAGTFTDAIVRYRGKPSWEK